ncbi:MAG: RuBisCO large subunit C-terminal-like domain-containing protein [Candidatus Hodarchaeota archaeon]
MTKEPEWDEIALEYMSRPNAIAEAIDYEKNLIVSYIGNMPRAYPPMYLAQALCVEQSTGTFIPVPAETPETRRKHVARVIGVYSLPDYEYNEWIPKEENKFRRVFVQIAYPMNFTPQIPMMFSTIYGNIALAGPLKMVDVRFPKAFLEGFKGPKFGDMGIRKILGVPERPLLNNMIKPCVYTDPKVGAELAYEAAVGGADIIKDDELLSDTDFNPTIDRVVAFMEALDRADSEKGEKTLYTVNITDRIKKMFDLADSVQEHGGNALMVNYIAVGYSAVRELAEDPSIKIPILGHMDFAGTLYNDPWSGISSPIVLGKLGRLVGCDTIVFPAPYGKAITPKDKYLEITRQMVMPFGHIKRTLPMPSGGITPGIIDKIIADLGNNIMIGSGGGIHAHPDGAIAGAKAFRQAIDAVMKGIPIKQAAKDEKNRELGVSMGLFGSSKTTFTSV